jgi:hypothetical protein
MSDQPTAIDVDEAAAPHETAGVGEETRVRCPKDGALYGPHPDSTEPFHYCPYCGDGVDDEQHDAQTVDGEVFCEKTIMSTYRYCPGCGAEVA